MTIKAFLKTAWNHHADRPQEVAARIATSSHLVETPEHLAAFHPFERSFAHSVLACRHRASGDAVVFAENRQVAWRYFEQTSEEERKWCENERNEFES